MLEPDNSTDCCGNYPTCDNKKTRRQQPPVHVVLGVRHSVLFNDALGGQVGNGAAEAISADVISPGEAVPPG